VNIDPVAAAIDEAEHAEAETRYRLQLARESFEAGFALGATRAREALLEEQAEAQRLAAAEITPVLLSPCYAELEERRWGPGGRAHFADPRPGDFPGRGIEALMRLRGTEPEKEAQAE
jgi:hypothetical protein